MRCLSELCRKKHIKYAAVTLLILFSYSLRFIESGNAWNGRAKLLMRSCIYVGIMIAWGVSCHRRIIQKQARRLLLAIDVLMIFWVVIRTPKYGIPMPPVIERHIWYMYYIPILLIPYLGMLTAFHLGKPENYRLPPGVRLLYIPTFILLVLVLTNDLHRLAFAFPFGSDRFGNGEYTHEIVYFAVAIWVCLCVVTMIGIIFIKSVSEGRKKRILLPLLPLAIVILYVVLYFLAPNFISFYAADLSVFICIIVMAVFEACFATHLIHTNTRHEELFRMSAIRAYITDESCHVLLATDTAEPIASETLCSARKCPVMLGERMRLSSSPIRGGYVFLVNDVSELTQVLEQLAHIREELEDENAVLRENYKTEKQLQRLKTKNRLYDQITKQTTDQLKLLEELVNRFERAETEAEKRRILQKMQIVGVYLKRRNNLILIGEQQANLSAREPEFCFSEMLQKLEMCGVDCALYIRISHDPIIAAVTEMLELYERVVEYAFDGLESLLLRIYENGEELVLSITADCKCDLSMFAIAPATVFTLEAGIQTLTLRIKGGVVT